MIRIDCPWCGVRDHSEFTYGGDGTLTRPDPETATIDDWNDYIYLRDNPRGRHTELWHHTQGCRQWLSVVRDTLTHEVFEVATARPDNGGEASS